MGWEKILGTIIMFGATGGIVAGMQDSAEQIAQRDIRNDDFGAQLFENAQENQRLLALIVEVDPLEKIAPEQFRKMQSTLRRLLELEENLSHMPKKDASTTDTADFYYSDVRDACRALVKELVAVKQKAHIEKVKSYDQLQTALKKLEQINQLEQSDEKTNKIREQKKIVRAAEKLFKEKDVNPFPNAADLVENLKAITDQAKDSAWNIRQIMMQQYSKG